MMGSNVLSIGASVTGIMPAITVRKLVTEASPRKGLVAAPGAGSFERVSKHSGSVVPQLLRLLRRYSGNPKCWRNLWKSFLGGYVVW